MTSFRLETDGAGRDCIVGELDGKGVYLVLEHVMYDRAHGHGWLTNDARNSLARLSPIALSGSLTVAGLFPGWAPCARVLPVGDRGRAPAQGPRHYTQPRSRFPE